METLSRFPENNTFTFLFGWPAAILVYAFGKVIGKAFSFATADAASDDDDDARSMLHLSEFFLFISHKEPVAQWRESTTR